MQETVASPLRAWESFSVIVGSSAAALTGLMFVAIALIAQHRSRGSKPQIAAFATPTVVHFCAALLVSAMLTAPWAALESAALALGATGVVGCGYTVVITLRARRQRGYHPVLEDWVWHAVLPLVAYVAVVIGATRLVRAPASALFEVAGATLLLVFVGIHNAWDTVTYIAVEGIARPDDGAR